MSTHSAAHHHVVVVTDDGPQVLTRAPYSAALLAGTSAAG
jgi:hypothetical protein